MAVTLLSTGLDFYYKIWSGLMTVFLFTDKTACMSKSLGNLLQINLICLKNYNGRWVTSLYAVYINTNDFANVILFSLNSHTRIISVSRWKCKNVLKMLTWAFMFNVSNVYWEQQMVTCRKKKQEPKHSFYDSLIKKRETYLYLSYIKICL